jgi:hypothetical protein
MLDEVGKFVLQDLVGESFRGLFVRALSVRARCLKIAGWLCAMLSGISFVAVVYWPNAVPSATASIVGVVAALVGLSCGFVTALINNWITNSSD